MNKITVHNLSKLPVAPLSEFKELQGDFKTAGSDQIDKLKKAIQERGFKYPFFAWKDKAGQKWIIDAHRRKQALEELEQDGYEIPPVPYILITAKSKKEAVEEIAYLNSRYGEINPETSLFKDFDIDLAGLDIEIPELSLSGFTRPDYNNEEHNQGKSFKNSDYYFVEFFKTPELFKEIEELLKPLTTENSQHELDPVKFHELIMTWKSATNS